MASEVKRAGRKGGLEGRRDVGKIPEGYRKDTGSEMGACAHWPTGVDLRCHLRWEWLAIPKKTNQNTFVPVPRASKY